MQQPPRGRPPFPPPQPPSGSGPVPGRTPAGPPPGYGARPAAPPPAAAPGAPPSPALAAYAAQVYGAPAPKRKGGGILRFFAGTCIVSAWLSLVLTVVMTIGSFMMGETMASMGQALSVLGSAGGGAGGDLTGGLGTGGLGGEPGGILDGTGLEGAGLPGAGGSGGLGGGIGAVTGMLRLAGLIGGLITLLSGLCMWFMLFGLGKLAYAHLELQEEAWSLRQALQTALARVGPEGR